MSHYTLYPQLNDAERGLLSEYEDRIAHLLFHRGVKTNEDARQFISPDYSAIADNFKLLKNIELATARIIKAIENKEKIIIYSDYDADGIPGAVILSDFFKKIKYENVEVYIPHRNREGFGLNISALEKLADDGAQLIITIDCGISDIAEAKFAQELGIDLIITDHHEPHDELPPAYAIVNPKLPDCQYPEKMICGSAVIFRVVQALIHFGNYDIHEGWEKWLLDMVGIATVSDMVPLTGENRVFAHFGLQVLRKSPRKGLMKLLRKSGTYQKGLNEEDIGFTISPRINAASRMGEPKLAFQLLSTDDEIEADTLVDHLSKINDERKGHVASMVKELNKYILKNIGENPTVVATGNPKWQPSLLGLAANSIAEKYQCPVFLWGRGDGKELKGSCRSIPGVNTFEVMKAMPENFFTVYGGHAEAGGFVLPIQSVDIMQREFEKAMSVLEVLEKIQKYVDIEITIDDITNDLYLSLQKLSPFGNANPQPYFLIKTAVPSYVKQFGKTANHMEIGFKNSKGNTLRAISFFSDDSSFTKKPQANESADFIVTIEKSSFGGKTELRMRLIDCV